MFGVRYIAINDNVDTENAESNDLMPFKNLFNEWFIRDTSRKIRAVQKAKAERGERLGTRAPYGYVKDLETKKLVIDEEAAAVVKRIFALCAAGNGPSQIARILKKEQVLTPTMYAYAKYGMTHTGLDTQRPYHWSGDTVADMLENEIYLGNTVNYRFSTRSYKDKRKIEHPREECLVFENTHPAIIPKEVWDIVQRVRKNKRRRTKMDEQNKYSGLVICADCGKTMVLHRAHTMSADYNHFTCRTYKKDGEACTAHYIRECILDEIVLEDLRRVTVEAREHPQEFAEYLNSKQSAELQKEIRKLEKEKSAMQKRKAELDAIFKKLYEDSVLGRITAEQFQLLSASYTDEQAKLTESLPQRESEIHRLKETVSNTAAFLDKAKRYTDIQALTPELLRLFIQKIVVHEKEVKWSKHAPQTVEIHYADIGCMENPAGARNTSRVIPAAIVTPVRGQQTAEGTFLRRIDTKRLQNAPRDDRIDPHEKEYADAGLVHR
ncbi:MAG: recombinase family protein [Subdoligranulum variabile]|nr:recombinase family protein [Subdoligranulum variabile]